MWNWAITLCIATASRRYCFARTIRTPVAFTDRQMPKDFKDGFDEYVVHRNPSAVNPNRTGMKAGAPTS